MRAPDQAISTYSASTVDFIPLRGLTVNGLPVTPEDVVEVSVVGEWNLPGPYEAADLRDGVLGFTLDGPELGRGVFAIYVRVVREDLAPVIRAGRIRLT